MIYVLLSGDFPRLFCRRRDTDLRFCQLNALNGEAIADDHHRDLLPLELKRRLVNAIAIYMKYTSPLAYDAETGMELVEHHIMHQCIPALLDKEISSFDIENIFWLINEYKTLGEHFITLARLYYFISQLDNVKIKRLLCGLSWAKIVPVLVRGLTLGIRDHDMFVKNSFRQILALRENQREQERTHQHQQLQQQHNNSH